MPVLSDGTVVHMARPPRPPLAVGIVRGARGLPGTPGGGEGSVGFEHTQSSPSASWVIGVPVSFGRRPNVALYVAGEEVEADVTASSTTVSVQFPTPTSGSAVLS